MSDSEELEEKVLGRAIGAALSVNVPNRPRINARGSRRGAPRAKLPPKKRVRVNPNARDADGDGLLQDGTTAERAARGAPVRTVRPARAVVKKPRNEAPKPKKPAARRVLPPRKRRPDPKKTPKPEVKPNTPEVQPDAKKPKRVVAQAANKRPNRRPLPPRKRVQPNQGLPAPRPEERQETPRPKTPLPPNRRGIMRGDRPKVTSLRSADFTDQEKKTIGRGETDVTSDWNLWNTPDKWDSMNEVGKKADSLSMQWREALDEQDGVITRLRDSLWIRNNQDKIRDNQVRYMELKERIAALRSANRIATERYVVLQNRKAAEAYIDKLKTVDSKDLDQRALLIKELEEMKLRRVNVAGEVAEGETAFWDNIQERLNIYKEQYKADLFERNGPEELEDILKFGGRRMRAEQDEIDGLVGEVKNNPNDTEAKLQLEEKLSDLEGEAEDLGPEVPVLDDDPDLDIRKLENNKRRFLKKNISKVKGVLFGGQKLMSYYKFESKKKPDVVGEISEDGSPKQIVSKNISTAEEASEFVRNGGSLNDVPNKFWGYALKSNSSLDKVDKNSRFRQIPPNGGAIGFTLIFQARDDDGKATQTGWVIKAASDRETVGEVLSQNLMREHGFMVDGGGYDGNVGELDALGRERGAGRAGKTDTFAVLPFALNAAPEGEARLGGANNYDPTMLAGEPDAALPARLHGMLHNYMMSVSDRHSGNGFTVNTPQGPMVVPIDQGWAGQARYSLDEYVNWGYGMDNRLDEKIRDHLYIVARGDKEDAQRQLEAVTAVYDGMIERAESVVAKGRDGFAALASMNGTTMDAIEVSERIDELYDMYENNLEGLKRNRDNMIASFRPRNI